MNERIKGMKKMEILINYFHIGHAQSDFVNRVYSHLQQTLKEKCGRVFFCPTQYCARMANLNVSKSDYLIDLGKYLNVKIDIFWTVRKMKFKNKQTTKNKNKNLIIMNQNGLDQNK